MRRRDFLKTTAAASLLLSPLSFASRARAQAQSADLLWFFVDARGAWDPTQLCDPKGGEPFAGYFSEGEIRAAGNLRYAPANRVNGNLVDYLGGPDESRTPFFQRYANDLVIVNGVDTKTNSHDVGPRHVWSGNLRTGYPSLAALIAAIKEQEAGQKLPMAMLSTGGFDATAGLLPPARAGNINALLDLTLPNRINPRDPNNQNLLHNPRVYEQIQAAEAARRARQDPERMLPAVRRAMEQQWASRDVESAFAELHREIGNMPELSTREAANRVIPSARVALAGMAGGVCAATMLSLGGFDTHQNHDDPNTGQRARLQELLDAIDYVARTTQALGLYERSVIVVGADFARTIYNGAPADNTRGKDHWPITSMMLMGGPVSGGRVIGQTDRGPLESGAPANLKGHRASKVKEVGGEIVVAANDDPAAEIITPTRVHQSLRTLAGIDGNPITHKFELPDLPAAPLPFV